MPQKSMKPNKKAKRSKIYYAVIGLCIILSSVYITLRIIDGLRFKNIKQDVATIGQDIQSITPATKHKTVLYCDYTNMKYARGSRSCYAKYRSYYEGVDYVQAVKIYSRAHQTVNKTYDSAAVSSFGQSKEKLQSYHFEKRGLSCYEEAWFYKDPSSPPFENNFFKYGQDIQGLVVSVGCSGSAMADYYPVMDL